MLFRQFASGTGLNVDFIFCNFMLFKEYACGSGLLGLDVILALVQV